MEAGSHERRIQTVCLIVLTVIAVGAALAWLRPVLVPFVLALFFGIVLTPAIELQIRWFRMPRGVALVSALVLGILLLLVLAGLVSISVAELNENREAYLQRLRDLVELAESHVPDWVPFRPDPEVDPLLTTLQRFMRPALANVSAAILDVLSQGLLVVIFLGFLMTGRGALPSPPPPGFWREAEWRVKKYLIGKIAISLATALLTYAVLVTLRIPLAVVFALFAFLLNFIPSLGSIVAVLLPLPILVMDPSVSPLRSVLALVIPGVLQFSMGNVIEPRVLGRSLDLHPVVILMSLIFWGMLWGFVGMVLSVPIMAVIRILLEQLDYTRPVAELLAGRRHRAADSA